MPSQTTQPAQTPTHPTSPSRAPQFARRRRDRASVTYDAHTEAQRTTPEPDLTHRPRVKHHGQGDDVALRRARQKMTRTIRTHLDAGRSNLLCLAVPPGIGKTHAAAALGAPAVPGAYDLAYIVERHSMAVEVPTLAGYRRIEVPNEKTCSDYAIHETLGMKGYRTIRLHKRHRCPYFAQFRTKTTHSTIYQLPHLATPYPSRHQGIVIDEFQLGNWIIEKVFTRDMLLRSAQAEVEGSAGRKLLDTLAALLWSLPRGASLSGCEVMARLREMVGHELDGWLDKLTTAGIDKQERPDPDQIPTTLAAAIQLAGVTLPGLIRVLAKERKAQARACAGRANGQGNVTWNSCLRITAPTCSAAPQISIYELRRIQSQDSGTLPPMILLDATPPDDAILRGIFGKPVRIIRTEVPLPSHIRHVAYTQKRYGKRALTYNGQDRQRLIAELLHVLREFDPDGALRADGRVGLITYQGIEREVGDALGIAASHTGHFWGVRGSNRFQDCTLLLVVGTPTIRPEEVYQWACVLYQDDPTPIDPTAKRAGGIYIYHDRRLQQLSAYLTNAELTQCAHRSRPLLYPNRTIIRFGKGNVEYLPVPEQRRFPGHLTEDGRLKTIIAAVDGERRLAQAYAELADSGIRPTVVRLRARAQVRKQTAVRWLKDRRTAA